MFLAKGLRNQNLSLRLESSVGKQSHNFSRFCCDRLRRVFRDRTLR
ncbi:hypothetical protein [Anabaena azotica]